MTFSAVVLSFYLLFPVFTPQQYDIAYAFGREKKTVQQQNQICAELRTFLDLPESEQPEQADQGQNVFADDVDVPLPGGLENPEYGPQSAASSLVSGDNNGTEGAEQSVAEKQYLNSQNRLRLFEYGEEQFTINKDSKNQRSVVSVNQDTFTRTRYDDSYRIQDKIVWKNGDTSKNTIIIKKTTYQYKKNDNQAALDNPPAFEKPISSVVEIPGEKKSIETDFDANGNPVKVEYAHFIDDPDEVKKAADDKARAEKKAAADGNAPLPANTSESIPKTFTQKKIIDKKTVRTYDDTNRVLTEEETTYFTIPDPMRRGKTKPSMLIKKNEYEYTQKSKTPDFKFYEDGVLRMTTLYIDETTYENTMYFDNDYCVKTKYSNGRKVEEIIYSGAVEVKRRNFEE